MDQNLMLTTLVLAVRNQISRSDGEFLSEYDLTHQQYGVLMALALESEEMSVTSLASYIGVRQPTMTGIVKRLEQKQLLLKKSSSEDSRRIQIKLSPKAKKLLKKIEPKKNRSEPSPFDKLTTNEKKQLLKLLKKLLK